MRTRAAAICFYVSESSSAGLVSRSTVPFRTLTNAWVICISSLHEFSAHLVVLFKVFARLKRWIWCYGPVWWTWVRSERQAVWNEHPQGNQITRQLFCSPALGWVLVTTLTHLLKCVLVNPGFAWYNKRVFHSSSENLRPFSWVLHLPVSDGIWSSLRLSVMGDPNSPICWSVSFRFPWSGTC